MSDKHLSISAWKAFSKGKGYEDTALLKAFTELDKLDAGKAEARLKALDIVARQCEPLAKAGKAKGDKPLLAYLQDVLDQLKAERKAIEAAASSADDDADAPDLLTTKMAALLKDVRKGVTLHAMLAVGSPDSAVLLSRKAISPPRRSVLTDYLGTTSGVKIVPGQCIWEENAFTFVLASASLAPAKKLRAALKAQVGLLAKVRVRGEDPADVDEGEEDDAAAKAPAAAGKPEPKDAKAAPDPAAELMARLTPLQPRIKAHLAAGGPVAKDINLIVSEIGALSRQKRLAQAHTLVDALEKRLQSPPPLPERLPAAADLFRQRLTALVPQLKAVATAGRDNAEPVAAQQKVATGLAQQKKFDEALKALDELEALLDAGPALVVKAMGGSRQDDQANPSGGTMRLWQEARDVVGEQLSALDRALRDTGHPLMIRVADQGLNALTKRLQVGMQVALMDYDGAAEPVRDKAARRVRAAMGEYRTFLRENAVLPMLQSNPLGIDIDISGTLGTALDRIEESLAA
jgi:hypothetical protein